MGGLVYDSGRSTTTFRRPVTSFLKDIDTSDQLQNQQTATLASAALSLISDQITGLSFYTSPRDGT